MYLLVLILIEFDVENLPLANTDAGVAALVGLVTVMATLVLHRTVVTDGYLRIVDQGVCR